jgi:demethylmenaquinone methyltransferase/2-methoxy-6-polyprenyl-1,4-benzoquinol methylase
MSLLPSEQADFLLIPTAKRQYNELLFAEVARRYDFVTRALSLGRDQAWKRELLHALPEEGPSPVPGTPVCVDIACGTGDVTFALARRYPKGTVCGLDLTPEMLAIAQLRNPYLNVKLELGDMNDLPITSASVDIVTGSYALRNAPELKVALQEIHRILRPGGTAAFLDFSKSQNIFFQHLTFVILFIWGSMWGLLLHRQPSVYAYIAKSLQQFPNRIELRRALSFAGLALVSSRRFYFGTLEMITVVKPNSESISSPSV